MRNYPLKYRWIYLNEKYYLLSSYESSLQLSHRVKIITLSIVELKKEPSGRTRFDSTCRAPLIKLAASQRVGEIIRRVLFFLVSKKFNLLRERARIHTYTHTRTHAHTLYLLLFRAFCSAREFFKGNRRPVGQKNRVPRSSVCRSNQILLRLHIYLFFEFYALCRID